MTVLSTVITPRFYETDALGHINNAAIAAWFEVARVNLLESLSDSSGSATHWVLASLHIDFVAETLYGSDVIADVTSIKPGNSSLTVVCDMRQNGNLTVTGTAVLVHLGAGSKTSAPMPAVLRSRLNEVIQSLPAAETVSG